MPEEKKTYRVTVMMMREYSCTVDIEASDAWSAGGLVGRAIDSRDFAKLNPTDWKFDGASDPWVVSDGVKAV